MAPELSEYCRVRIGREFSPAEQEKAENLLLSYGPAIHHREPERVRRDLLQLAAGDLEKLQQYFDLADRDYRDLMVAAEYLPDPTRKGPWNLKKKATPWLNEP